MFREVLPRSKQLEIFRFLPRIGYFHHNGHSGSYPTGLPCQNGNFAVVAHIFLKFFRRSRATFWGVAGHFWPAGHRLGTTGLNQRQGLCTNVYRRKSYNLWKIRKFKPICLETSLECIYRWSVFHSFGKLVPVGWPSNGKRSSAKRNFGCRYDLWFVYNIFVYFVYKIYIYRWIIVGPLNHSWVIGCFFNTILVSTPNCRLQNHCWVTKLFLGLRVLVGLPRYCCC